MKETGIIRRIDDLGRVVIPKEIRKTMQISEGDPLEIYLEDNGVLFKKYSGIESIEKSAQQIADIIYKQLNMTILITDTDKVVAESPAKQKSKCKRLSSKLIQAIKQGDIISSNDRLISASDSYELPILFSMPIRNISGGYYESWGAVILIEPVDSNIAQTEKEIALAQMATDILAVQIGN